MNVLQLSFLILTAVNVNAECWHFYNSTEYFVSDNANSFDDARSSCGSLQAELVMIQTEDAQVFVKYFLSNYRSGDD